MRTHSIVLALLFLAFLTPLSFLEARTKPVKISTSCVLKSLSINGRTVTQNEILSENQRGSSNTSSKKVKCDIVPHTISDGLDISTVTLLSSKNFLKPTISGVASESKTVQLSVHNEADTKPIYQKTLKVKNGKWKAEISKKLYDGNYKLEVSDEKTLTSNNVLSGILTISTSTEASNKTKSATTFVVESVPLLFGGTARAGDFVPVSYLQITNVGNESANLKGFRVTQNGSASVRSVIGFTTTDDLGFVTGSTDVVEGSTPFKNGLAYAPVNVMFGPNQMRLFTVKAILGRNIFSDLGKQLKIDLASVDTTANVKGFFPIRGTTWTIVN